MKLSDSKVCVIGAGPSGLTAAKNCLQYGLDVTVFEKNNRVGGNWVFNAKTGHSSVYNNTHIISSKVWSEYEDFPMPEDYPDYPKHDQIQEYFESYAKHFGVMQRINFETSVIKIEKISEYEWHVSFQNEQGQETTEIFTHVMLANGHHWKPNYPEYPGKYTGQYMHSHDFKGVDDSWKGKSVLVIGAGNSACDVAVESARVAGSVAMSMRSPQWFIPKFMFGKPADELGTLTNRLPKKLRQLLFTGLLKLMQGRYRKYNLPEPQELVLNQHPTLNSDLLDFIRHGRIKPMPAIKSFNGKEVLFSDGSTESYDTIVACTGFKISFPFFDKAFIDFEDKSKVPLYRKMLHTEHKSLYFIGLFQPLGCIWPLADYQAKIACEEITGSYQRPKDLTAAIAKEISNPHFDFQQSARHSTEVDYHRFRRELKTELKSVGVDIGQAPSGRKKHYKDFSTEKATN